MVDACFLIDLVGLAERGEDRPLPVAAGVMAAFTAALVVATLVGLFGALSLTGMSWMEAAAMLPDELLLGSKTLLAGCVIVRVLTGEAETRRACLSLVGDGVYTMRTERSLGRDELFKQGPLFD